MASPKTGGYDHEFLDPPAKLKEFECPLCLLVTREPNLTSCCGQHFCQSCINRIITDRKPCPLCKKLRFSTLLDKKQKRKVLELKVNCLMKDRGCRWTGRLGELHSHRNSGCQFMDVNCPNRNEPTKEKDQMIEPHGNKIAALESSTKVLHSVEFIVSNYCQKKRIRKDGPSFHIQPQGVKVQVCTYCSVSRFYVELYRLPGEFDDEIKWPVKCTVTVRLINQYRDHDHISGSMTLTLTRPQEKMYTGEPDLLTVPYSTIDRFRVGIQYLKNDCLKLHVGAYVDLM